MKNLICWGAAVSWIAFCFYYISHSKIKLSVWTLLLMMPQWCQMSNFDGTNNIVLSTQATIRYCFVTAVLLAICWYITAEDDVKEISTEVTKIDEYLKNKIEEDEKTEEVLLENANSLLEKVDLEYKHCAATIAVNNETHGKRVGGEAEWATGETSSEDEDATREITGAHLQKSPKKTQEDKIFEFLQHKSDDLPNLNDIKEEPNLTTLPSEIDDKEVGVEVFEGQDN